MSEQDRVSARILERLAGSPNTFRTELAQLVVDHVLVQRVREVVDLAQLRTVIFHASTADNLRRVVERHVVPGLERYAQSIVEHAARVGSLVSPTAHQKLHVVVRKWKLPRARWAENALDPSLVRELLRPVWTQVLLNFAKRLPIPGVQAAGASRGAAAHGGGGSSSGQGSSGLTGLISRTVQERAEKLIDRGRSAMGGLGAEVERRLSSAARDFSDGAAQAFRESLHERLQSEEGRELLGQIMAGLTDHVLRTRFADLHADAETVPMPELVDLVPDLLSYAARSSFVQEIAERELAEWMTSQGDRHLGELLQEYGLLAELRPQLVTRVEVITAGFVGTPRFANWLAALVRTDEKAE
jgi:hypothetical protein